MKIIGLGHRRGVGKSTCARIFRDEAMKRGLRPTVKAFADTMKDVAAWVFGWAGLRSAEFYEEKYHLKEEKLPGLDMTPRDIWISLGQWGISICPRTWVNCLLHNMPDCDILIIPDVRFIHEIEAIWERDGVIIKVERDSCKKYNDKADSALEWFKDWNYVIRNNGTIEDLRRTCDRILSSIYLAGTF